MNKEEIRVIFVDDDTFLGNVVSQGLILLGHKVHYQSSILGLGVIISGFRPNVIVLDVEIGDRDGIDESVGLHALFPSIPIIFVSSHIELSYVARAINSGGMIYLKKPIDIEELAVYINRYSAVGFNNSVAIGDFSLDATSRILLNITHEDSCTLNKKECDLLYLLINNLGAVVTRDMILEQVWNNDFSSDRILNNYISKLRKYLSDDSSILIETLPREGYRLICDNN